MMDHKQLLTSVSSSCGLPSEHHPVTQLLRYQSDSMQDCWRE